MLDYMKAGEWEESCTLTEPETSLSSTSRRAIRRDVEYQPDHQPHRNWNDDRSYWLAIAALCSCRLVVSYLVISPFPYAGYMAIELVDGVNEENSGRYAGLISAGFMFGRAFGSYPWGTLADRYGRVIVLQSSLAFAFIFSLTFGLSTSLLGALLSRVLLGLGNGIAGTTKTMVTELAANHCKGKMKAMDSKKEEEELESRGMSITFSVRALGLLLGPAVSGLLSDPAKHHPNLFKSGSVLHRIFTRYPFVLPNLVACVLCIMSMLFISLCLTETLPESQRSDPTFIAVDIWRWFVSKLCIFPRLLASYREENDAKIDVECGRVENDQEENASFFDSNSDTESTERITGSSSTLSLSSLLLSNVIDHSDVGENTGLAFETDDVANSEMNLNCEDDSQQKASITAIMKNKLARSHLFASWLISFADSSISEAFPLFCLSRAAGLGFDEGRIGATLTGAGVIFLICQHFIYTRLNDNLGLYRTLTIATLVSNPIIILLPISILLKSWTVIMMTYICLVMACVKVFSTISGITLTIATNKSVIESHRASTNGLSMVGTSVARCSGPIFSGWLVAFFTTSDFVLPIKYGSLGIFSIISMMGLVAALYASQLPRVL